MAVLDVRKPFLEQPADQVDEGRGDAAGQRRHLQQRRRRLGTEEVGGQASHCRFVERLEGQLPGAVPLEEGDQVGHGPRRTVRPERQDPEHGQPEQPLGEDAQRRRGLAIDGVDVVDAQQQRLALRRPLELGGEPADRPERRLVRDGVGADRPVEHRFGTVEQRRQQRGHRDGVVERGRHRAPDLEPVDVGTRHRLIEQPALAEPGAALDEQDRPTPGLGVAQVPIDERRASAWRPLSAGASSARLDMVMDTVIAVPQVAGCNSGPT